MELYIKRLKKFLLIFFCNFENKVVNTVGKFCQISKHLITHALFETIENFTPHTKLLISPK